jgi:hypothetical protein
MDDGDDRNILPPIELPVQELRPKGTAEIQLIVDNTGPYCRHYAKTVDSQRRKVTCATCEAELDPFDSLLAVANEHERVGRDLNNVRREIRGAESRLALLKRLEDNARARCKKLDVKASRQHLDRLVQLAKEHGSRIRDKWIEQYVDQLGPVARCQVALQLLDKKEPDAALVEFERAATELIALFAEEPAATVAERSTDLEKP